MTFPEKRNKHRPFHIYDGHTYFVTGRCYKKRLYLERDECKGIFKSLLEKARKRFDIHLFSWVVLRNHYHLMFALPQRWDDEANSAKETAGAITDFVSRETQSVIPRFPNERNDTLSLAAKCVTHNSVTDFSISLADQSTDDLKYPLVEFIRKLHKDTSRKINKLDSTPGRKVWHQYWEHSLVPTLNKAYYYSYSSNPIWLERFGHDGLWDSFVRYPVREEMQKDCE
jgi:hypothetical protein